MYHKHSDKHIWRQRNNRIYVCHTVPSGIAFFRNRLHINQTFLSKPVCPFSPLFLWRYRNISNWCYSGYHFKSLHLPTAITVVFFFLCTSNRKWVGDLSYCCVISPCKFNLFIATTVAFKIENKYDALVKIMHLRVA